MKLTKQFMKYLNENLPKEYHARQSPDGNEIVITKGGEYIYLFYKQEIEEDLELCCSLVHTILDLNR